MEIRVKQGDIVEEAVDALIVNLFQGVSSPGGGTGAVDAALGGAISDVIASGDLTGKLGETVVLYPAGRIPARRVIVVGLGESAKFGRLQARKAAGAAIRKARDLGARTVATITHGAGIGGLDPAVAAEATVEGSLLGLYRFAGYRSSERAETKADPERLLILVKDAGQVAALERGAERGRHIAGAVALARDLVNQPANYMTPTLLAEVAQKVAGESGLSVEVLDPAAMGELGMGIALAVGVESEEPTRFIVLEHNAGRHGLPTVVLCGKGVTFDSGGISIKPTEGMWQMKDDMAGGAAVIAALGLVARLQLPLHVVGLVPAAENLPGGRAQKPGDVYRGMTGKTMEVITTDAEGRMLLADALAYAGRFNPAAVVDIATLTGAQVVALGPVAAGLFANDDSLAGKLLSAAEQSGDRLWRLPLYEEYLEPIKSQVADVKNSGGRMGGVGTSAKFLEHFTEGYPWAHIDMASMAWADEDKPDQPKGGTGYGVRLLLAFLENWA